MWFFQCRFVRWNDFVVFSFLRRILKENEKELIFVFRSMWKYLSSVLKILIKLSIISGCFFLVFPSIQQFETNRSPVRLAKVSRNWWRYPTLKFCKRAIRWIRSSSTRYFESIWPRHKHISRKGISLQPM